jgi:hypothetical protein
MHIRVHNEDKYLTSASLRDSFIPSLIVAKSADPISVK